MRRSHGEEEEHGGPGVRHLRLQREMLDACRSYILPSATDPVFAELEVTRVDLAGDLCNVTVHLAPTVAESAPALALVRPALERAGGYFRRMLAEAVPMKRTPKVHLAYWPTRPDAPPPPADSAPSAPSAPPAPARPSPPSPDRAE